MADIPNPCSKRPFSSPLKILFIENDRAFQTIFKCFFEAICDCVVEQIYHLNTACSCQKKPYDIIFVRQFLPQGDSLDFIKAYHKKRPLVPIIVFTTWVTDKENFLLAGASTVLFYPLTVKELKELMKKYLVPDK